MRLPLSGRDHTCSGSVASGSPLTKLGLGGGWAGLDVSLLEARLHTMRKTAAHSSTMLTSVDSSVGTKAHATVGTEAVAALTTTSRTLSWDVELYPAI